jgi:hypothetical protein
MVNEVNCAGMSIKTEMNLKSDWKSEAFLPIIILCTWTAGLSSSKSLQHLFTPKSDTS